jgi:hypothetical protein
MMPRSLRKCSLKFFKLPNKKKKKFFSFVDYNSYDALLGAEDNWKEFCLRGVFHGGDSDSTAIIGGCWFGALYGFKNVFPINYTGLEKLEILALLGEDLYEAAKKS